MDSTAADARAGKRARRAPPAAGDADRISGLDDDVLLRVLKLVGDARDAVRTGALSRRWLGLWTRAPALRFASRLVSPAAGGEEHRAALERYVSFVNGVLARRARSGCAVECLAISISYTNTYAGRSPERPLLQAASVDAAQGWIRYAFEHGVKSFAVDLHDVPPKRDEHEEDSDEEEDGDRHRHRDDDGEKGSSGAEQPLVIIDELLLPSPARLETMRLALGDAGLQFPTTMKFASLTDLSLERIKIARGGAHLLGRLVSPANCPRLQKLRMSKLRLPSSDEGMQLDADVLSELWVEDFNVRSLELRTPNLRVLHIDIRCHELLRVSAPMLEELAFFQLGRTPPRLEVDGDLVHVRSLKLYLIAHRSADPEIDSESDSEIDSESDSDSDSESESESESDEAGNDTNILLLKHCSSLTCLDVILAGPKVNEDDVDMITSSVPQLDHVTSLTVHVFDVFERHDFGVGVASLLTRFKNLRHLSLHLPCFDSLLYDYDPPEGLDQCDHPDHWASDEISMTHLQEVELTGLTGTGCELGFMKAVLTSAGGLRKVAATFNPKCRQPERKMDAFESMLLDQGMRTSHREAFTLILIPA
ncbi:hypothetical protein PVAP13_4NG059100 [Panicum virgatum]|uniref:FBD domain-containing protein n=1 Tax=Panicum virgatum TaxID=38727 RepID=A0A8T0SXY1_PANVG|nr:hypothetical protein PVAP13_4NG059100 [Panicum virgatum]